MYFEGIILGAVSFLLIGILHPIVIYGEYYFSKKIWPLFLISGLLCLAASVRTADIVWSGCLSVAGFSLLWSIFEIIEQEKRVLRGWFPKNPKRKYDEKI